MQKELLAEHLRRYHPGALCAATSRELERTFSIKGTELRQLVNQLRRAGIPIASNSSGYFYAATEQEVRTAVKESGFPIVKSRCPADGVTTREDTKDFVRERCRTDRAFRQKTLHALQESGIDGWRPLHPARTSNKEDTAHADTTL